MNLKAFNSITGKIFCFQLAKKNCLLFSSASLILFLFVLWLNLHIKGTPVHEFALFKIFRGYSLNVFILDSLTFLTGINLIFLVPGLLYITGFYKRTFSPSEILFHAFFISIGLLFFTTTLFKLIFKMPITQTSFLSILMTLLFIGLLSNIKKNESSIAKFPLHRTSILIFLLCIILLFSLIWFFQNKILWHHFDNNFSQAHVLMIPFGNQSDVHEQFGKIISLKRHLWPYWDLEYSNKFGYVIIDPPLHQFLNSFLFSIFGNQFGIVSIFNLLLVPLMLMIAVMIAGIKSKGFFQNLMTLLLPCVVTFSYIITLIVNKDSYISLVDMSFLMTFFVLSFFYFLFKKSWTLSLACSFMAFITQYESALFVSFGIIFYWLFHPFDRKQILLMFYKYLGLIIIYFFFISMMGLMNGNLDVYIKSLIIEKLTRFDLAGLLRKIYQSGSGGWPSYKLMNSVLFLRTYIIATLGTGIFIFTRKKDMLSNYFSFIAIIYLCLIAISRYNRFHYLTPLIFFSVIVTTRLYANAEN